MVKMKISSLCKFLILAGLLLTGSALLAEEPTGKALAPKRISAMLGCLVATQFIQGNLKELGLATGSLAWIRYHVGSIPGMGPTPGVVYIAVYSEDGLSGWLMLADKDSKGNFLPVRNAYRLTKEGHSWTADEGNGGLGTYRAMSKFATKLSQTKRYRVKIEPNTQGCAAPDP